MWFSLIWSGSLWFEVVKQVISDFLRCASLWRMLLVHFFGVKFCFRLSIFVPAKLFDFVFWLFRVAPTCLKFFNVSQIVFVVLGFLMLFAMLLVSSCLSRLDCCLLYVVECVSGGFTLFFDVFTMCFSKFFSTCVQLFQLFWMLFQAVQIVSTCLRSVWLVPSCVMFFAR